MEDDKDWIAKESISTPRKKWALTKKMDNSLLFLSGSVTTMIWKHGHCDRNIDQVK